MKIQTDLFMYKADGSGDSHRKESLQPIMSKYNLLIINTYQWCKRVHIIIDLFPSQSNSLDFENVISLNAIR